MNPRIKHPLLDHLNLLVFISMLIVFGAYSLFLAFNLKRSIIPDEPAHLIFSQHYASTWTIPADVQQTYAQGWYIEQNPFLYYWLNGRALNALHLFVPDAADWQDLVFLRLISVFYALGTVTFCYFLSREIIHHEWWQLLPVFLLTNTLMFVFLSAGVNYDNLANLCSMAGLFYLVRVFHHKNFVTNSLAWMLSLSLGTLVKYPILPLTLAAGIAWLIFTLKYRKSLMPLKLTSWKTALLAALVLVAFIANLAIYGVNLVKYQSVTPACIDLLPRTQCELSPYALRHQELRLDHKLTIAETIELGYPNPLEYVIDSWIPNILYRIYGILGHISYFPTGIIIFYRLLFLWILVLAFKYLKRPSFGVLSLVGIFFFYSLVLFYINYNSELTYGFRQIAMQGRYLFPVIGAAYVLFGYIMVNVHNKILRNLTLVATLILFFLGGPIKFITLYETIFKGWFI